MIKHNEKYTKIICSKRKCTPLNIGCLLMGFAMGPCVLVLVLCEDIPLAPLFFLTGVLSIVFFGFGGIYAYLTSNEIVVWNNGLFNTDIPFSKREVKKCLLENGIFTLSYYDEKSKKLDLASRFTHDDIQEFINLLVKHGITVELSSNAQQQGYTKPKQANSHHTRQHTDIREEIFENNNEERVHRRRIMEDKGNSLDIGLDTQEDAPKQQKHKRRLEF